MIALVLVPGSVRGQSAADPQVDTVASHPPGYRSPVLAALLQAAVPPLPLGYLYVGDPGRGLLPTVVMVGGASLVLIEAVELIDWTDGRGSGGLLYLGLGAMMGGYVFGIWDATRAAGERNRRLAQQAPRVALAPSPQGGVRLAVRLPVP